MSTFAKRTTTASSIPGRATTARRSAVGVNAWPARPATTPSSGSTIRCAAPSATPKAIGWSKRRRRRRGLCHPPPPRMPGLPPAIHHAGAERGAEHQGREERRRPRAVRAAEDQAGFGKSLLEAAGHRRAVGADRLGDRNRSARQVRGRGRKLLARRAVDAAPAADWTRWPTSALPASIASSRTSTTSSRSWSRCWPNSAATRRATSATRIRQLGRAKRAMAHRRRQLAFAKTLEIRPAILLGSSSLGG